MKYILLIFCFLFLMIVQYLLDFLGDYNRLLSRTIDGYKQLLIQKNELVWLDIVRFTMNSDYLKDVMLVNVLLFVCV